MNEPIPVRVTRYACPTCSRTHSGKTQARRHIARCWWNPEARGCKTCKHFDAGDHADYTTGYPGFDESCRAGESLAGRPRCERCGGGGEIYIGDVFEGTGGVSECPECAGDGEEIKPGPIVHCHAWEADEVIGALLAEKAGENQAADPEPALDGELWPATATPAGEN